MVQFTHKNIYTVSRYINPKTNVWSKTNRMRAKANMYEQLRKSGYDPKHATSSNAVINAAMRNVLGPKHLQRQEGQRNLFSNTFNWTRKSRKTSRKTRRSRH